MPDIYQQVGYQPEERIGFGERPGIVVIDFQTAFTDPKYPLGGRPMVTAAVDETARLLKAARAARAPVATCFTAYTSDRDAPYWKIPTVVNDFHHGKPGTEIDPRIYDPDYDTVFCKTGPSIFFQTPVASFFTKERVDTVIVTGCNTSGCVRASIIEGFSLGYRVIVPETCVGDVDRRPHDDNLRDVGRRYADVVALDEVMDYLEQVRGRNHEAASL